METVKYLEESMGESFDSGTRKAFFGLKKKKKEEMIMKESLIDLIMQNKDVLFVKKKKQIRTLKSICNIEPITHV